MRVAVAGWFWCVCLGGWGMEGAVAVRKACHIQGLEWRDSPMRIEPAWDLRSAFGLAASLCWLPRLDIRTLRQNPEP